MSEYKFQKKEEKMTLMGCGGHLKLQLIISYLGIISDLEITKVGIIKVEIIKAGIIKDGNKTMAGVRIIWEGKMEE